MLDVLFLILGILARVLGLWWRFGEIWQQPDKALRQYCLPCACLAWSVLDLVLRTCINDDWLPKWRYSSALCLRMLMSLEACFGWPDLLPATLSKGRYAQSTLSTLLSSRLWLLMIIGCCYPLSFKWHLPVHLVASICLAMTVGLDACRPFDDVGTCQAVVDTDSWHTVDRLMLWLDAGAKNILQSVFLPMSSSGDFLWVVQEPCAQTVLFLYFFLGFVVLSYVIWFIENRARLVFIKSNLTEDQQELELINQLPFFALVAYNMCLVVSLAIFWRFLVSWTPEVYLWKERLPLWLLHPL